MEPAIDLNAIQAYNDTLLAQAEKEQQQALEIALAQTVAEQVAISGKEIQNSLLVAIGALIRTLQAHKPEVSVTNQPAPVILDSVVEAVKENTEEVKASNERLSELTGKESDFSSVIEVLERLEKAIEKSEASRPAPPTSVSIDNQLDYTPHFGELNASLMGAISSQQPPIVNAPPPDLTPIQQQMAADSSKILPPNLNLGTYRAHDIDEMDQDVQYIGFINLEGYWYILKNDMKNNSLRYTFGKGNYEDAWAYAPTLSYFPLEEAIRAIKT